MNNIAFIFILRTSICLCVVIKRDFPKSYEHFQYQPPTSYAHPVVNHLPLPQTPPLLECRNDGPNKCLLPPIDFQKVSHENPLLAAYILSTVLGLHPKMVGYNHPDHLPLNPYLTLLFSHYGRYPPVYARGKGLYSYTAANNYHNNKPFGSYKIYEENDG